MAKKTNTTFIIQKVKRTRKRIFIAYSNGHEVLTIDSDENALPEFQPALDALAPIICRVIEVQPNYALNMRVMGIDIGEQGEARTAIFHAQKSLSEASKAFPIKTPFRLLEHPTEPGSYTPPLNAEELELIETFLECAKDYAMGKRAQGVLPGIGSTLDDDNEGGGEQPDDDKLPGTEDAANTRKGGKRKKAGVKKGKVEPFPGSDHPPGQ